MLCVQYYLQSIRYKFNSTLQSKGSHLLLSLAVYIICGSCFVECVVEHDFNMYGFEQILIFFVTFFVIRKLYFLLNIYSPNFTDQSIRFNEVPLYFISAPHSQRIATVHGLLSNSHISLRRVHHFNWPGPGTGQMVLQTHNGGGEGGRLAEGSRLLLVFVLFCPQRLTARVIARWLVRVINAANAVTPSIWVCMRRRGALQFVLSYAHRHKYHQNISTQCAMADLQKERTASLKTKDVHEQPANDIDIFIKIEHVSRLRRK